MTQVFRIMMTGGLKDIVLDPAVQVGRPLGMAPEYLPVPFTATLMT